MDYADLRLLETVARHGSMNRAATELNTVQSNVTARVRALEAQVGTALFERSSRGVVLTAAGQRLLPYAARLAALLEEAREAALDDGAPRGSLRLGCLETTAALRLPPILSAYTRAYPQVGLAFGTGTSADLVTDVLERRLDGAFVSGPVLHPDLTGEVVFREELTLVTAPALGGLDDLARQREPRIIVFREGCSYRQRLENLLSQRGVRITQPLEFGSLETIIGCVAAGVGVTLLPRAVVAQACLDGRIVAHELPREQAQVDTVFVRRAEARQSSALAAFLEMARPATLRLAGE